MSVLKSTSVFLVFFIAFLILGFYGYHLYKYPSDEELSNRVGGLRQYYPDEFIMKIGSALKFPSPNSQHFLKFLPKKKKEGIIRIGTFGDSHTYGAEVNKESAYPSQLKIFLNNYFPLQKIEVLNFGMGAHSFQEQFLLWEKYAKLYGIDYILYGPRGLHADRNLTFGKNWEVERIMNFRFPRSRFVLVDEKKVRLIALKGISLVEKFKNYYTLFPSFTALRHDKNPFQLLQFYLPILRDKLDNRFYYSDLPDRIESRKINQILLNEIKSVYNKKVLFFISRGTDFRDYKSVKSLYHLKFWIGFYSSRFLYKVYSHPSSLGNEIVARVYFNALVGKNKINFDIINCYFNNKTQPLKKKRFNFYNVKKIFLGSENILLGEIRLNVSDHYHIKGGASFFQNTPKNIKNFIGFSNISTNSFGLSPYYPVPFKLNNKSTVSMQFSGGGVTVSHWVT